MPFICYGCGKKTPLDKMCENCAYFTEDRSVGFAACLNEDVPEEYAFGTSSIDCPGYEEATIGDVCVECAARYYAE